MGLGVAVNEDHAIIFINVNTNILQTFSVTSLLIRLICPSIIKLVSQHS